VSLVAYNGGGTSATVTIACPDQTTKTQTLSAGQISTITTGFSASCTTVTLTTTNGWFTNFDDIVHEGVGGARVFEAESMSILSGYVNSSGNIFSDSTASAGRGMSILSNGEISQTVSGAFSKLVVRAKGDQCDGAPTMVVKVDGATVMTKSVNNAAWVDYSLDAVYGAGTHTVKISFTNDHNPGYCDRNLRVDMVTVQ
jgi:hypothetical protein